MVDRRTLSIEPYHHHPTNQERGGKMRERFESVELIASAFMNPVNDEEHKFLTMSLAATLSHIGL